MTLYSTALFLHVVGALVLFTAFALEWTGLRFLRRTKTIQEVRQWMLVLGLPKRLYLSALAAILLPGIYMAVARWGSPAWIDVAFVLVLLLAATGIVITRSRMMAIGRALATGSDAVSAELRSRLTDRVLWASIHVRTGLGIGIIFLMTERPGLVGSLFAVAVAACLGFAVALPGWKASSLQTQPAEQSIMHQARRADA
jgi:hypothetical protein